MALYQITHSFQDQKRSYSSDSLVVKKYRYWRQQGLKKKPTTKQPNKKETKLAPTRAISRKPFCSILQFMLSTTPAGQGNMHLSSGHCNQNSSLCHPHQQAHVSTSRSADETLFLNTCRMDLVSCCRHKHPPCPGLQWNSIKSCFQAGRDKS